MKKNLAKKVTLSILAGAVLMSSSVVWAAEPIKDGADNILWEYFPPANGYVRNPVDNLNGTVPDDATYSENFYGAYVFNSTAATGGKVTISGGTFAGDVFGGFVAINNPSATCNASGNIVTISGGTFAGNIIGGYSDCGVATDNTVTISGNANLENSNLYGGAK